MGRLPQIQTAMRSTMTIRSASLLVALLAGMLAGPPALAQQDQELGSSLSGLLDYARQGNPE